MNKRNYEEMKINKKLRFYKNKSLFYFENEEDELKFFKYKNNKQFIIHRLCTEDEHISKKEIDFKKNIVYPICLMPKNATFTFEDKNYQFKYYDNIQEIVIAQEGTYKKKVLFQPTLKAKRVYK